MMADENRFQYRTVEEWLAATGQSQISAVKVKKAAQKADANPLAIAEAIVPRGEAWKQRGEQTRDTRTIAASYLIDMVARAHGYTVSELQARDNRPAVSRARHEAMVLVWMVRRDMTTPQIAKLFGRTDHTTVLNALRKAGLL